MKNPIKSINLVPDLTKAGMKRKKKIRIANSMPNLEDINDAPKENKARNKKIKLPKALNERVKKVKDNNDINDAVSKLDDKPILRLLYSEKKSSAPVIPNIPAIGIEILGKKICR